MQFNIVTVSQYLPRVGGIEFIVADLCTRLTARGHQIAVVTEAPAEVDAPSFEMLDGVAVHRYQSPVGDAVFMAVEAVDTLARGAWSIARVARDIDASLIHAHFAKNEALMAQPAARLLGIPLLVTGHGTDLMFDYGGMCADPWSRRWVALALRGADRVTTVSRALKRNALRLGAKKETVEVVHNWIDPAPYGSPPLPTKTEARERTSWGDEFVFFTARRLVEKNGVDILIEAATRLEAEGASRPFRVVVQGDGPEKHALKRLASRTDATVEFLPFGAREVYLTRLKAADVFVLPSRWEGFGLVILESFATRTPVLATHVGGVPEVVAHGETGRLCAPDLDAMAEAMRQCLDRPDVGDEMAARAHAEVASGGRFHCTTGIDRYEALYRELIGQAQRETMESARSR